jgi:hypothetical protein
MRRFVIIVLMLLLAMSVVAQDTKQENKPARNDFGWARNPFRLDYTIKEMEDGKVVNTRTYSLVMQSAEERGRSMGEVKTGSRVPVATSSGKDGPAQIQYLDVGINIRAQLYVLENSNLLLDNSIEISTLASGPDASANALAPVIRQIRTNTTSEVSGGKANQLASLDDPISKHRFVIEVTPTKLR